MKVLILGASGMLGNAMIRKLTENPSLEVFGTIRSSSAARHFSAEIAQRLVSGVDVERHDALVDVIGSVRPDAVINCIGLVKQLADADDPLISLPINAMLPHRLARLCKIAGARFVHVSTDCVFNGKRGNYSEADISDAEDLYGKSKYLGEVRDENAITLRTSIIGHELAGSHGLVDWFLSQDGPIKGYARAIFSGLPTVELARVVSEIVLSNPALNGVYNVASQPISKLDLLQLVSKVYGRTTIIERDDSVIIDRSLNAERFHAATGYVAPSWADLINSMHEFDRRD